MGSGRDYQVEPAGLWADREVDAAKAECLAELAFQAVAPDGRADAATDREPQTVMVEAVGGSVEGDGASRSAELVLVDAGELARVAEAIAGTKSQ